jgi:two-component system copper resistance phosphate regulon response regulator CusR
MKILLAEDEEQIAEHVRDGLVADGYAVDVAEDGDEALRLAESNPYDALLLDINMPHKDGVTIVRTLRHKGINTPVIFLTARQEIEDKVQGLDAGADDYLPKPFSVSELLARLRAVLRRQQPHAANLVRVADLELDLISHEARRAGQTVELTRREFALLEFLISASPQPVSKSAIVEHVWDQNFDSGTNVVNVYIKMLRDKIDRPGLVPLIHTVRNVGFALRETAP